MMLQVKAAIFGLALLAQTVSTTGCNYSSPSADSIQTHLQEQNAQEMVSEVGLPAITNFREKRELKDLYEVRDEKGLITYSYIFVPMTGKFVFLCNSIGYPFPYGTQYTAGEAEKKFTTYNADGSVYSYGSERLPQAEPNGLYPPPSADATWVMCLTPDGNEVNDGHKHVLPAYIEDKVEAFPYKLKASQVQ